MLDDARPLFEAIPLESRIGVEIKSNVSTLLSGVHAAEIRALLEERGVVVIRQINFTDEQQVRFTKTLGDAVAEGENGVYKISLDPLENLQAEYLKGAFYWHIDGTMQEIPIFASLMSARRLSEVGGDTQFCNTYAAWDDLPASAQNSIEKLRVVHSFEASQRYVNPEPSHAELVDWQAIGTNTLPLVWTHRSGRKSLVLGSTAAYVEGMTPEASAELLCRLRDYATQPQFVYSHKWSVGDLAIWDNTGTMHRATAYPLDSGRMMHRTKLHGDEPFA